MRERIIDSKEQLQESMWIEIIKTMDKMYAQLANSQAEIERKSRELQEAKDFTDNIIRSMVDSLIVGDSRGNIKIVNRATLELLGYREDEIIGKPVEILFYDKALGEKLFSIATQRGRIFVEGTVRDLEVDFYSKTGEHIPMTLSGSTIKDSNGEILGVVAVAKDLRETKSLLAKAAAAEAERAKAAELEKAYRELQQLQAQLIHAEKMASIGKLAAGVAHEINNPLGSILIYSDLLLEDLAPDDPHRENIEKIVRQTLRCKDIVSGLLNFARQSEPKIERCDINKLLEDTFSLIQNQSIFHNIRVSKKFFPGLPVPDIDIVQLQQVFINIILNAAEAMDGQGDLTISTAQSEDNKLIEITFVDTGCGIPLENLDRIFEPFFTTKKVGQGTGLGLAICYGIVQRHGGTIEVKSENGKGTAFTVKIPVKKEG